MQTEADKTQGGFTHEQSVPELAASRETECQRDSFKKPIRRMAPCPIGLL